MSSTFCVKCFASKDNVGFHLLGTLADQPRCDIPQNYFQERDCIIDARGRDCLIISGDCNIGWWVKIITQTHNTRPGYFGDVQNRPTVIHAKAFIGGGATLYNCVIGEGAIVALESVVRSRIVPAWTMVEGNPARIIKIYERTADKWVKVTPIDLEPMRRTE